MNLPINPVSSASPRWREWVGNTLVLAALIVLSLLLWRWQAEPLQWLNPGRERLLWASAIVGVYVAAILMTSWQRRASGRARALAPTDAGAMLVVYASQTGFAEQLAEQTASTLRAGGLPVRTLSVAALDAETLAKASHALIIAATTGEGDAPDSAATFMRQVMESPMCLPQLAYGVLALGDRDYSDYCAFGRQIDHWLNQCGARALFDRVDVDNGDAGALRHWQHHLRQLSGSAELPDWEAPIYASWTLGKRELLNPGSAGHACFHLELTPASTRDLQWTAGDIAEVGPRHSPAEVANFLRACGLSGDALVNFAGRQQRLADRLAASILVADVVPTTPQVLSDSLLALPHREYSIASLPADGAVHLLVRQMQHPDGRLGLGSGWLTGHASIGTSVALRLRRNSAFHPPPDARPVIMIGNGTGLAGLRALLKARIAAGHRRNWLLFGERCAAHDKFYGVEIEAWQQRGFIEILDRVWSRDTPSRRYVQDRLREQSANLIQWVKSGAAIYVCGSLEGMAPGVHAALTEMLGEQALADLAESGRYRRDVY